MKEIIKELKEHGLLRIIEDEVDIDLEIPHIAYVEIKKEDLFIFNSIISHHGKLKSFYNPDGGYDILSFFTKNEIKNLKDIANISKVHYLYIQKGIENVDKIKNIARFLSWLEIYKMNNEHIEKLKKGAKL